MGDQTFLGVHDYADALLQRADGSCEFPGIKLDLSGLVGADLGVGGIYHVECIKPDGTTRWVDTAKNAVTTAGLNYILNAGLSNQTVVTTWYVGLVDNSGFTAFAAADTMGSHGGWTELQAYSDSTRISWGNGTASGGSVTNASTLDFDMNATNTVRGLFLTSVSTKGGTTGTLFSTAAFTGGNQAVGNGDTLKVTYTVTATAS